MSQRKDSYRAALQRDPVTPRSGGGFVIRTRPVCITIDVAPGVRRVLGRVADNTIASGVVHPAAVAVARTVVRQAGRVRRMF